MVRARVTTAAILIPPVVAATWFFPTWAIACIFAGLILMGAWEWGAFMGLQQLLQRWAYLALVTIALLLVWWASAFALSVWIILAAALIAWLIACAMIVRYPQVPKRIFSHPAITGLAGLLVLVPAFLSVVAIHALEPDGPVWLLFVVLLVWAADSSAYFGGRRFGEHKLAPAVSPGKTWEGATCGAAAGVGVGLILGWALFGLTGVGLLLFGLLSAVIVVFSVVGDLTVSMFKRSAGVKDSGSIFPGHGGAMDRLDSLFAAAPWFYVGLKLMDLS